MPFKTNILKQRSSLKTGIIWTSWIAHGCFLILKRKRNDWWVFNILLILNIYFDEYLVWLLNCRKRLDNNSTALLLQHLLRRSSDWVQSQSMGHPPDFFWKLLTWTNFQPCKNAPWLTLLWWGFLSEVKISRSTGEKVFYCRQQNEAIPVLTESSLATNQSTNHLHLHYYNEGRLNLNSAPLRKTCNNVYTVRKVHLRSIIPAEPSILLVGGEWDTLRPIICIKFITLWGNNESWKLRGPLGGTQKYTSSATFSYFFKL